MRDALTLFDALQRRGWTRDGDTLFAPSRSIWLKISPGYPDRAAGFLDDMLSRRQRLDRVRELSPNYEQLVADVESAIAAARMVALDEE